MTRAMAPKIDDSLFEELARLLREMLAGYRDLITAMERQREALRRADAEQVGEATTAQQAALTRIADLEASRRTLVARVEASPLGVRLQRKPGKPVTLTEIALCAPASRREELTALAEELRRRAEAAQSLSGLLRAATASLIAHMEGLARSVGQRLSHARVYTPRGVVEAGNAVVTGLDVRL